ncbi:hypothetical protein [Methylobacterium sp. J-070]|uniref:hypothetical protein n=1 Tax=Methylobacterium sp. J-070 TaxID=2836650 RepID=UPI001FB96EB1|nr:hypothetical protein [Methylobacterium sp. J-070]MCJ2049250.1 hypothetical protein [Methylobacterium sp. J-070]
MALAATRDAGMEVSEVMLGVERPPEHGRRALLDGRPVPMAPPRRRHRAIVAGPIRRIGDAADPRRVAGGLSPATMRPDRGREGEGEGRWRAGDGWRVAAFRLDGTGALPDIDRTLAF